MNFLKEDCLKSATPYMLRNDGKLVDCSPLHPYIKYNIWNSNKDEIEHLFNDNWQFIEWFYKNTQHEEVKQDLDLFIFNVLSLGYYNINNKENYKIKENELKLNENEIEDLFIELNNELNQEFCRVRTSNMRFGGTSGDIYFRISSIEFNWFNLIWNLVAENSDFITSVSISTDTQSRGGRPEFYIVKGIKIYQLDVNEFLTLKGNPIIENTDISKSLSNGNSLKLSFYNIHPAHINNCFLQLREAFIKQNFKG